jgi:hypothetical protein
VAQRDRLVGGGGGALDGDVDVGAADPHRRHLDERVVGAEVGYRDLFDPQWLPGLVEPRRGHQIWVGHLCSSTRPEAGRRV